MIIKDKTGEGDVAYPKRYWINKIIVICQIAVCNDRSYGFINTTKEQQLFIWMTGDCNEIPNLFYPILRSILLYS